jgi:hypothetical protein
MEFSENTIGLRIVPHFRQAAKLTLIPDIMGSAAKINAQNKNRGGDMQMTANKNRIGQEVCNFNHRACC